MNTALLDQLEAAVAESRRMLVDALGIPEHRPMKDATSPLFEELWATIVDASRCWHLDATPVQPWMMLLPDRTWRCRPCARQWAATRRLLGLDFGPVEEYLCDRCRRYVAPIGNKSGMTPIILRQDVWMVTASLCPECQDFAVAQGARQVTPKPRPGRNDPCPCGSGAKTKRCCGDRSRP